MKDHPFVFNILMDLKKIDHKLPDASHDEVDDILQTIAATPKEID